MIDSKLEHNECPGINDLVLLNKTCELQKYIVISEAVMLLAWMLIRLTKLTCIIPVRTTYRYRLIT